MIKTICCEELDGEFEYDDSNDFYLDLKNGDLPIYCVWTEEDDYIIEVSDVDGSNHLVGCAADDNFWVGIERISFANIKEYMQEHFPDEDASYWEVD